MVAFPVSDTCALTCAAAGSWATAPGAATPATRPVERIKESAANADFFFIGLLIESNGARLKAVRGGEAPARRGLWRAGPAEPRQGWDGFPPRAYLVLRRKDRMAS